MPIPLKLKPLNAEILARFSKGTRVRANGGAMCGRHGTVYRPVKTRGVICVEFDGHGCLFDARPELIDPITKGDLTDAYV